MICYQAQDIPAALAEQKGALWDHFVQYGQHEGRPFKFTCGHMREVVSVIFHISFFKHNTDHKGCLHHQLLRAFRTFKYTKW